MRRWVRALRSPNLGVGRLQVTYQPRKNDMSPFRRSWASVAPVMSAGRRLLVVQITKYPIGPDPFRWIRTPFRRPIRKDRSSWGDADRA
jgi:hypothetical protein